MPAAGPPMLEGKVTGARLLALDDGALRALGVGSALHRRKLLGRRDALARASLLLGGADPLDVEGALDWSAGEVAAWLSRARSPGGGGGGGRALPAAAVAALWGARVDGTLLLALSPALLREAKLDEEDVQTAWKIILSLRKKLGFRASGLPLEPTTSSQAPLHVDQKGSQAQPESEDLVTNNTHSEEHTEPCELDEQEKASSSEEEERTSSDLQSNREEEKQEDKDRGDSPLMEVPPEDDSTAEASLQGTSGLPSMHDHLQPDDRVEVENQLLETDVKISPKGERAPTKHEYNNSQETEVPDLDLLPGLEGEGTAQYGLRTYAAARDFAVLLNSLENQSEEPLATNGQPSPTASIPQTDGSEHRPIIIEETGPDEKKEIQDVKSNLNATLNILDFIEQKILASSLIENIKSNKPLMNVSRQENIDEVIHLISDRIQSVGEDMLKRFRTMKTFVKQDPNYALPQYAQELNRCIKAGREIFASEYPELILGPKEKNRAFVAALVYFAFPRLEGGSGSEEDNNFPGSSVLVRALRQSLHATAHHGRAQKSKHVSSVSFGRLDLDLGLEKALGIKLEWHQKEQVFARLQQGGQKVGACAFLYVFAGLPLPPKTDWEEPTVAKLEEELAVEETMERLDMFIDASQCICELKKSIADIVKETKKDAGSSEELSRSSFEAIFAPAIRLGHGQFDCSKLFGQILSLKTHSHSNSEKEPEMKWSSFIGFVIEMLLLRLSALQWAVSDQRYRRSPKWIKSAMQKVLGSIHKLFAVEGHLPPSIQSHMKKLERNTTVGRNQKIFESLGVLCPEGRLQQLLDYVVEYEKRLGDMQSILQLNPTMPGALSLGLGPTLLAPQAAGRVGNFTRLPPGGGGGGSNGAGASPQGGKPDPLRVSLEDRWLLGKLEEQATTLQEGAAYLGALAAEHGGRRARLAEAAAVAAAAAAGRGRAARAGSGGQRRRRRRGDAEGERARRLAAQVENELRASIAQELPKLEDLMRRVENIERAVSLQEKDNHHHGQTHNRHHQLPAAMGRSWTKTNTTSGGTASKRLGASLPRPSGPTSIEASNSMVSLRVLISFIRQIECNIVKTTHEISTLCEYILSSGADAHDNLDCGGDALS